MAEFMKSFCKIRPTPATYQYANELVTGIYYMKPKTKPRYEVIVSRTGKLSGVFINEVAAIKFLISELGDSEIQAIKKHLREVERKVTAQ